jgi:hypothetical protein
MKTVKRGFGQTFTAYQDKDLEDPDFKAKVEKATAQWKQNIEAFVAGKGDFGTCVLGAGIHIHYLPPKCRKPRKYNLINPHQICRYQGSVVWEESVDSIVMQLQRAGIDAWFEYGRMD